MRSKENIEAWKEESAQEARRAHMKDRERAIKRGQVYAETMRKRGHEYELQRQN
jgi:hypothetical protein